jgi:hypothetical protein
MRIEPLRVELGDRSVMSLVVMTLNVPLWQRFIGASYQSYFYDSGSIEETDSKPI